MNEDLLMWAKKSLLFSQHIDLVCFTFIVWIHAISIILNVVLYVHCINYGFCALAPRKTVQNMILDLYNSAYIEVLEGKGALLAGAGEAIQN